MHHPTDRIVIREIAQWLYHGGLIRQPIALRVNARPWNYISLPDARTQGRKNLFYLTEPSTHFYGCTTSLKPGMERKLKVALHQIK